MSKKLYPFSAAKHAHDIELVANRTYNLAHEALDRKDYDAYDKYMELHEKADEVLLAVQSGMINFKVSMLEGEMLGRAKEMVCIAATIRDGSLMQYMENNDVLSVSDSGSKR